MVAQLKNIKRKVEDSLTDKNSGKAGGGETSFKRVQGAIFTGMFIIVVMANLIFKAKLDDNLLNLLSFILVYNYTGIAIEGYKKTGVMGRPPVRGKK